MEKQDTPKKRRIFALLACGAAAVLLAGALFGCSSGNADNPDDNGGAAADEPIANAVNPWIDATSIDELVAKAGFDAAIVDSPASSLGTPVAVHYRAMEGMIEVIYEYPACEVTVRKGLPSLGENGDISGDYGVYENTWTQSGVGKNAVDVTCNGNVKGTASRCLWSYDKYAYAITTVALGGEENFGLSSEDVAVFVDALV